MKISRENTVGTSGTVEYIHGIYALIQGIQGLTIHIHARAVWTAPSPSPLL